MVEWTLSLVQKCQTKGHNTLWIQYAVCSGIVVYGGGDIVFGAKRSTSGCSTQWMHWMQYLHSERSGCSGIVVYCGVSAVYYIQCIHLFDLFAPKTLSPPPYTTIPLRTACTILNFLYQRRCPHHHIPLFHGIHCALHTAYCVYRVHCVTAFTESTGLTFDNVPTTIYHYFYCIHCILHPLCTVSNAVTGLTLFAPKTMSPQPYTTIPLHAAHCVLHTADCVHCFDLFVSKTMSPPPYTTIPLRTASTAYCVHSVTASTESTCLTFLYQRQCPYHHIPLFRCIHCALHTASTAYCVHCVHCVLCPLCDCIH